MSRTAWTICFSIGWSLAAAMFALVTGEGDWIKESIGPVIAVVFAAWLMPDREQPK